MRRWRRAAAEQGWKCLQAPGGQRTEGEITYWPHGRACKGTGAGSAECSQHRACYLPLAPGSPSFVIAGASFLGTRSCLSAGVGTTGWAMACGRILLKLYLVRAGRWKEGYCLNANYGVGERLRAFKGRSRQRSEGKALPDRCR